MTSILFALLWLGLPAHADSSTATCAQQSASFCAQGNSDSPICRLLPAQGPETFITAHRFLEALTEINGDKREAFICARLIGKELNITYTYTFAYPEDVWTYTKYGPWSTPGWNDDKDTLKAGQFYSPIGVWWTFTAHYPEADAIRAQRTELARLGVDNPNVNVSITFQARITTVDFIFQQTDHRYKADITLEVLSQKATLNGKTPTSYLASLQAQVRAREDAILTTGH